MTYKAIRRPHYDSSEKSVTVNGDKVISYTTEFLVSETAKQISSTNSPRINGKLQLRPNAMTALEEDWGNPFFVVNETYNVLDRDIRYRTPVQPLSWAPTLSQIGLPLSGDDPAFSQAQTRLYSALSNTKINMAQIVAERQQLTNLVATTASRLAHLYRALRRGRNPFRGNRRSPPKQAANLWLEYAYAWSPTLGDIWTLAQLKDHAPPPLHVKGYGRSHLIVDRSSDVRDGGINQPATVTVLNSHTRRTTCTAEAWINIPVNGLKFAQEMGLTNPALLVWELLPYSFVVDWFLPIGNWLESQQALYGVVVDKASVTRKSTDVINMNVGFSNPDGYPWVTSSGAGKGFVKFTVKNRSLGMPAYPPLVLKNPLSISHATSAISLLVSSFMKR